MHAAQKDFEAAKEQAAKCQPAAAASASTAAAVAADAGRPTPAGGIAKKLAAKK